MPRQCHPSLAFAAATGIGKRAMAETELDELDRRRPPTAAEESEQLDEENRLKPEFVRSVARRARRGRRRPGLRTGRTAPPGRHRRPVRAARARRAPRAGRGDHRPDERRGHRRAQRLRPRGHGRGAAAAAVAEIAEQLDTDDAVQLIEDLDHADQQRDPRRDGAGRPRGDRERAGLSRKRPPAA